MTRKNLKLIIALAFLAWLMIIVGIAYSAAIWTQQAGTFNWYLKGTTNKYILTNAVDVTVPVGYVKQPGVYIQCKSEGGATKYWPQTHDCYGKQLAPVETSCGAFLCVDDFGLTVDLTKNTVLDCPRVKITKEQIAQFYEGKLAGVPACR
jgi:hypothetical protein